MDHTKIRVALIGAGAIGREQHVPAWGKVPEARIEAIADSSADALEATGELCPAARLVDDYRRLLDDPRIDVVDICAPSALHAELTSAALEAGKHVLCEKPMATSATDAAAILAAARRSGRKFMVGHHLRFDPGVLQLRRYLEKNSLGTVYHGRAQWLRRRRLPGKPSFTVRSLSGGGTLYDLGVHMFDLAWWMSGCPRPLAVSGATYNHLARRRDLRGEWGQWDAGSIDVEDFAVGLVRLEGGATLSLEVSWLGFQPQPEFWRMHLYGTRCGAVWPDCVVIGEDDSIPWEVQLARRPAEKPHHAVVREFARAVLDDTPVPVPPDQCATVISVLESLYRSQATGREQPVELFSDDPSDRF